MADRPISAGDVGRFAYCPLNWKRSAAGSRGEGGREGARKHRELAEQVDALEYYQRSSQASEHTALYFGLAAVSAAVLGVELFVLRSTQPEWFVLVTLSVALLAGSLYLVLFHLYFDRRARELVRGTQIHAGRIAFSDSARQPRLLRSRRFPLQGRPDYVVQRGDEYIPVELKTGKTPPRPYESHVLQLAAYCQLVSEEFGVRPPHGILAYPEGHFEVPFSEQLETDLLKTVLRIELARRTGEAHRNHENPARCAGCSRREGCPERLDRPAPGPGADSKP